MRSMSSPNDTIIMRHPSW